MPYIEETLRHDSFLDDLFDKVFRRFKDKSDNYWWPDFNEKVAKVDLYKISFERGLFVRDEEGHKLPEKPVEGQLCISRHAIMRRWDNEIVGFAQSTGSVKVNTEDIPTDKAEMLKWFTNFYKELVNYTTVYAYTMDSYEGYTHYEKNGVVAPITIMTDDSGAGVLKSSLDVEFYNEDEYFEGTKQSPLITMNLKGDLGDNVQSVGKLNFRTNTNWWGDSLIQLKGVFDETSAFFTLKADSAPEWADNMVTLVPFFFGNLIQKNATKRNETPTAILGGTQVGKFFDFDNIELQNEVLQPVTRNYTYHPSNGVDSVMLKKTKYGARYQEHFLRWNVPPSLMPPTREELRVTAADLEVAVPKRSGSISTILQGTEATIKLTQMDPYVKEAKFYESCRYVILDGTEIATIQSIDIENNKLNLLRKDQTTWSAGTKIKGYTSEALDAITRKYPRAWNYLRKGYYDYDFHASRYSDKIHTSRASVTHPEDGVVGYIPNIVLLPVINIVEGDKLKFPLWCAECSEPAYNPEAPEESTALDWKPVPVPKPDKPPTTGTPDVPDSGTPDVPDSGTPESPDSGTTNPAPTPSTDRFSYHCDKSVTAASIDTEYWTPSEITQEFFATNADGIGRKLATTFWEGRNDFIDYFTEPGEVRMERARLQISDFLKFQWKSIQDVKGGKESVPETWTQFKGWADTNLSCLTDLQKASLFMSAKLKKPVTFFTGSEGFLAGDILDKMEPIIQKVPSVVYDWMDFNNLYDEADPNAGTVGAFVIDDTSWEATLADGSKQNILETFKSLVNFEPQLLNYGFGSIKAHKPFDYLKPAVEPGAVDMFGSRVVGGEYTSYDKTEVTSTNYKPYVAAEVAVHEMAHSLAFYAFDKLGTALHDMKEWLDISGWVLKSDGSFDHLVKTKVGTLLDNGKLAPISDYGCFAPAEDFAEAFMMYVINRSFLKDKFKAKHDFIVAKLTALGINPNL